MNSIDIKTYDNNYENLYVVKKGELLELQYRFGYRYTWDMLESISHDLSLKDVIAKGFLTGLLPLLASRIEWFIQDEYVLGNPCFGETLDDEENESILSLKHDDLTFKVIMHDDLDIKKNFYGICFEIYCYYTLTKKDNT